MGCAAHGLQDEVFDSLFLHHGEYHDDGEQESLDPGIDGFLALDGYIETAPTPWLPIQALIEVYAQADITVDASLLEAMVNTMMTAYVNTEFGLDLARSIGEGLIDSLPWTRDHYMDPNVPGSLRAEVEPTRAYLEALWVRLHGHEAEVSPIIASFPPEKGRLRGNSASSPDAWVTLIYPAGVDRESLTAAWRADSQRDVSFILEGTQWGHPWTRLHRLKPTQDLMPAHRWRSSLSLASRLLRDPIIDAVDALYPHSVRKSTLRA